MQILNKIYDKCTCIGKNLVIVQHFFQNKPKAVTATDKLSNIFVKQTFSKGKCEYKLKSGLAPSENMLIRLLMVGDRVVLA